MIFISLSLSGGYLILADYLWFSHQANAHVAIVIVQLCTCAPTPTNEHTLTEIQTIFTGFKWAIILDLMI